MPVAHLSDRGVVSVTGADAMSLLQGLVTCDIDHLKPGDASLGALLTPQGKILFDFIVTPAPAGSLPGLDEDGFLFDVAAASAADLAKRLNFYKLRAKVAVTNRSDDFAVAARWNDEGAQLPGLALADPRLPALGQRAIAPAAAMAGLDGIDANAGHLAWRAHRIALAVPEGGADYAFGEVFPHEADLDQLGAIAFDKGCYVGQEVVSRMHHRGTARTRMVAARLDEGVVVSRGDDIMAGDKRIGDIRASAGASAIAMVRLDRYADALAAGVTPQVNGAQVALARPAWATFDMAGA